LHAHLIESLGPFFCIFIDTSPLPSILSAGEAHLRDKAIFLLGSGRLSNGEPEPSAPE
jgi:hypothetical protein